MKITRKNIYTGERKAVSTCIEDAFRDAAEPSFSNNDEDRAIERSVNLQNMLAKLVDILHDKGMVSTDEVERILNAGDSCDYKIEE